MCKAVLMRQLKIKLLKCFERFLCKTLICKSFDFYYIKIFGTRIVSEDKDDI